MRKGPIVIRGIALCCLVLGQGSSELTAQELPEASGRPLELDLSNDPVLNLKEHSLDRNVFRQAIAAAVLSHPQLREAEALKDVAQATLDEAKERQLPSADINLTTYRVISRAFSNDPDNIIERSRPDQRTDALLTIAQPVFDFGAGAARVAAARARILGAEADLESVSSQTALNSVAMYYEVFGYRALISLTRNFIRNEQQFRDALEARIESGVAAEADIARVATAEARAQVRLAQYRRLLAGAEARFVELTGLQVPALLERAPEPEGLPRSREEAGAAALAAPAVRAALAEAAAVDREARARKGDRLPSVTAGIDAGRYGVFETDRDYDIRGRLTVSWSLGGGVEPRIRQAEARAVAASARADRIEQQTVRDAIISWSDVQALEIQLEALEASYVASRQTRDVVIARFQARRGTAFDVAAAEEAYFDSATTYIQALIELDTARYLLLFQTGRLLESLDIDPELLENDFAHQ